MKQPILMVVLLAASYCVGAQENGSSRAALDEFLGPGEVAIVNDQRIPESIYRLFTIGTLQANPDSLTPQARAQVVRRLVYVFLLAQEAEQSGLDKERRIAATLELQRLQALAQFMSDRYAQNNPPSDAEMRELYEQNLPLLERTEYKTRHILVATEQEAKDLLKDLKKGQDFAQLAEENSIESTAENGGDLGWLTVDADSEPFAAAVAATTPGSYNPDPVETEYGWHIIKVDEVREVEAPSMAAVQADLIEAINAQKLAEHVDTLLAEANVEVVE